MQTAAFIAAYMPLMTLEDVPVRLHLATPASRISARLVRGGEAPPPYWAYRWSGGLALARHLFAHPELVRGRTVRDLGSGSGLVAIAAALNDAAAVTAVDIDPRAGVACGMNAAANGVGISIESGDALAWETPAEEVILAGDLFYDPDLACRSETFLARCSAAGCTVLIGDPGRAPLPRGRLESVAAYEVQEHDGRSPVRAEVLRLVRAPRTHTSSPRT